MKKKYFLLLLISAILTNAFCQQRTLNFYINEGLKNSPLLKDYSLQMASNGLDSLKVKASYKPKIDLTGQLYYAPSYKGYGYDAAITNGGNYATQVGISQPLIMKKSKRVQFETLNIQNQYLGNSSKISELDLKKAVSAQYITAYTDYMQLLSVKEVLNLLNDEADMLKPLVEHGIYTQTDFLNLMLLQQNQSLAIQQSQLQYNSDLYSLNILCGIDDTAFTTLSKPELALTVTYDANTSILLRKFRIDSLNFANRKKLVDLNYQPKLSAFADAGFMTSTPQTIYKNFGGGLGLNFAMPLYDGKQRKFEYQKIHLASQISQNYESFYRHQLNQQQLQLYEQLNATNKLIAETAKQIQLAQELINIYKEQLNKGLVKITDLILAVNNYINYKTSMNLTAMNKMQIINQLNYFK